MVGILKKTAIPLKKMKLVNETRKILEDNSIRITATVVRIPVQTSHSESVNIELKKKFELQNIYSILKSTPGVILKEDPTNFIYPVPLEATGKDDVL